MCAVSYVLFVVLFNEGNGLGEGIDSDGVELVRIRFLEIQSHQSHLPVNIQEGFFGIAEVVNKLKYVEKLARLI